MEDIISCVKGLAGPILDEKGLELVDIEYKMEGGPWVLRIFIDKVGGITLADCEAVSREVSAILDVKDIVPHSYNLEVSSPGIDRPLIKKEDFLRHKNKKARIKTKVPIEWRRNFSVIILDVDGEDVVVRDSENKIWKIPLENIEKARLEIQL